MAASILNGLSASGVLVEHFDLRDFSSSFMLIGLKIIFEPEILLLEAWVRGGGSKL